LAISFSATAKAPYVKAEKPIKDEQGRTKVIVDFAFDAHLKYPGALPVLPAKDARVAIEQKEFFHTEKTLALVADYEKRYGFQRVSMTSWVGNSVVSFLPPETVKRLLDDPLVVQVSDDSASTFSQMPSGGWQNSSSGNEWASWGHQAVNGKVSIGNTGRKIYVVDSGVGYHDDLPVIFRRNVSCNGGGGSSSGSTCSFIDPYTYPVVGCFGHATHVAGIIGALSGNNKTIKGVYAGFPNIVSLSVVTSNGSAFCGNSKPFAANIANALDYIAFDATQNNPLKLVHIATMSINDGGVWSRGLDVGPNWYKLKSLTTSIWAYGVPVQPGVFFVQSAGNQPGTVLPTGSSCDAAYKPDPFIPYLPDDGIMIVGASHHDGGAVTPSRPFSQFTPPASPGNYTSPSSTFPYGQTGLVQYGLSGPCVEIYAPGNLILSTWGIHANGAFPPPPSTLGNVSYSGSVSAPVSYGAHGSVPAPTQGWAFLSGTSMAAPFVAAAAAWLADTGNYTTAGALELAVRANVTWVTANASIPAVPVVRLP
jgi:hypothetical protein